MIPAPTRAAPAQRGPSLPRATAADGGDADNAEALSALSAQITALVARATSPDDEALQRQRQAFDFVVETRAELERETNALRDLAMEQVKHDDELLKKWIALI